MSGLADYTSLSAGSGLQVQSQIGGDGLCVTVASTSGSLLTDDDAVTDLMDDDGTTFLTDDVT